MHETGASPATFWIEWGRHLERMKRVEEGLVEVRTEMAQWRAWAKRGTILLVIWGSVVTAGVNHDLASSLLASMLRTLLRLPGSAG